jgi:Tol biopolymer transport system component
VRRRHQLIAAVLCLAQAHTALAQQIVTVREGTDVRLSANADGSQLSFDLAGRIWTVNPGDGTTVALTEPELLARRPALSPDSRSIVFDAGVPGRRQLWRIDTHGGEPELLTFGNFDNHSAVWHPDGERVAFVSNRNGSASIWELTLSGLSLRQRSFGSSDERDPTYSAEGDTLAYIASEGAGDALYSVGEDGRPERIVASASRMHVPSWRPDDSLLTFVHRGPGVSELRVVIRSEPPVVRRLTRGENLLLSPAVWLNADEFLYMADGRIRRRRFDDFQGVDLNFLARIELPDSAYERAPARLAGTTPAPVRGITGLARSGERAFVTGLGDLWELDSQGRVVEKLTPAPFLDTQLVGSPDGSQLAFISDRSGTLQVWLFELESGKQRQLTRESGGAFYPAWRPDGRAIAFLSEPYPDARNLVLKGVAVDTGEVVEVARGIPDTARPQWPSDTRLVVRVDAERRLVFHSDTTATVTRAETPGVSHWSPDGRRVAYLDGGTLLVAEPGGANAEPEVLADGDVSQPQWLEGGRTLAWLTPDGPVTWTADAAEDITPFPVTLTWQAASPPAERRLVIRAGRVFDGIGPDYEYAQDIVVAGDRIESMGPWRDPPPGELLEARELTVLPGLMDLSVQPRRPDGERAGRTWLAWGVTSIREFVTDAAASTERRESWASDQRRGPRLFPVISGCDGADPGLPVVGVAVCADQNGTSRAAAIREAGAAGVTAIAVDAFPGALLGAGELPLRGRPGEVPGYPDAANRFLYGDVIEVAGAARLVSVSRLSAIGLPGLLRDDTALLEDPRLVALIGPEHTQWYRQSWQAQAAAYSTNLRAEARTAGQSLFRAVGRGARIVTGSGAPAVPNGLGLHAELRLLRQTGLQPFQILRMATLDAATAMGAEDSLGAIREGLRADLALVRGDPLKNIEAAANVEIVVIDGRVYRAEALRSAQGVGNFYSR